MRCKGDRWYRSVDHRLCPNATQTRVLEHTLDILCGLYSNLLDIGLESLKEGGRLTSFDMMRRATAVAHSNPDLRKDIYSTCRNGVAMRVVRALSGCSYISEDDRSDSFSYPSPRDSDSMETGSCCRRSAASGTAMRLWTSSPRVRLCGPSAQR